MQFQKPIIYTTCVSWCLLGFVRGMNSYNYSYKKNNINNNDDYLYSSKLWYGIAGFCVYATAPFTPFLLVKEIYRLEINIRGLENGKNGDFYNNLLM